MLSGIVLFSSANTCAQELKASSTTSEVGQWTIMASPLTLHYSDLTNKTIAPEDKHSYVWLIGAEKMLMDKYFAGLHFSETRLRNLANTFTPVQSLAPWMTNPNYLRKFLQALFMAKSQHMTRKFQSILQADEDWALFQ